MGCYEPTGFLKFEGMNSEKQMMERLLQIMDVLNPDAEYKLPADFEDYYFPLALMGVLDEYDPQNGSYMTPSLDLELAPALFASLFPNASFHYVFTPWYSVTMDDTETITAIYKDKKLMIRRSYYDHERAKSLCQELIDQDAAALEKYQEYLEQEDLTEEEVKDDPYALDWFDLLEELTGQYDGKEVVDESYEFKELKPFRDDEFEESFFAEEDILFYLVKEQIKQDDDSVGSFVKDFSAQQIQDLIEIAKESNCSKALAMLEEEKENRISEKEG